MRTLLAALAVVALASAAEGTLLPVGVVEGGGQVFGSGAYVCDPVAYPAAAHVTMTKVIMPPPSFPESWDTSLQLASVCPPIAFAAECKSWGRLGDGVVLRPCVPLGGSGTLGPVITCTPGPSAGLPGDAVGSARLGFTTAEGVTFEGPLTLVLLGLAMDEAQNVCV